MECKYCSKNIEDGHTYVPGEGKEGGYFLLGVQPGETDEAQARPFVGSQGEYLFELLREIRVNRRELYISHAVKTRQNNRTTPTMSNLRDCRDSCLSAEIRRVEPMVIICLGLPPWKALTDNGQDSFLKNRRRVNWWYDEKIDSFIPFVMTWQVKDVMKNKFYEEYFLADLYAYIKEDAWDRRPFELDYIIE